MRVFPLLSAVTPATTASMSASVASSKNDLVHRRTRQETADGALGLKVGDRTGAVVAVEDEVVEADVEVVGIAGVAGQPANAVIANDPVVPRSPMIRCLPADPVS
jgi:hypothetical protein